MKYKAVKKMIHLKVPVLNEKTSIVPLTSVDAVVYGYLLFLVRKNKSANLTIVAESIRLDREATRKSLERLVELGLANKQGRAFIAQEIPPEGREWFRFLKNANGQWFEHLVYDRVWLPKASKQLSLRTNLLFWHLFRLGEEVKGMPGNLQVGNSEKKYPRYLTDAYLARAIRCERKTIRTGLRRLESLGLLRCVKREKGFAVGIVPIGNQIGLWRETWDDRKSTDITPLTVGELFDVPSTAVSEPEETPRAGILKRLRRSGITGSLAEELVAVILDNNVPFEEWQGLLKKSATTHARNKDEGKAKANHGGFLLRRMLTEWVQISKLRAADAEATHFITAEEMQMNDALARLRASDEARELLRIAIKRDSLHYRDGRMIPCPITYESVTSAAKEANGSWSVFKTSILDNVFKGSRQDADGCQWLEAWMMAEPLPEKDDSPLEAMGLGRWECGEVRRKLNYWFRDDGDADRIRTANFLVKVAAWQSTTVQGKKPLDRVLNALQELEDILTNREQQNDDPVDAQAEEIPQRIKNLGKRWFKKTLSVA